MRLFIGLCLNAQARLMLAKAADRSETLTSARFVAPELYHITLAYLGERDETALPQLHRLLAQSANSVQPFQLTSTRFGFFGSSANAIFYAALAPCEALNTLTYDLRARLREASETFDEQPFTPHITLARKAKLMADVPLCAFPPISFSVQTLTLFHSTSATGMLCYLPILTIPLGREAGGYA